MKVDLPTLNDKLDVEAFLDWVKNVENFFEYLKTLDNNKSKISSMKIEFQRFDVVGSNSNQPALNGQESNQELPTNGEDDEKTIFAGRYWTNSLPTIAKVQTRK